MTLCRFLFRSLRRYSTAYPPQTSISTTAATATTATEGFNHNFDSHQTTTNAFESATSGFTAATVTTPGSLSHNLPPPPTSPSPYRSDGLSPAERAEAIRRQRKRRLRIEPPLYALRPNPSWNQSHVNNPDRPPVPDSTSALVGPRLNLHNRVQSLARAGDLDSASYVARQSVFHAIRPTVFTCNAIIAAMYRAKRYQDAKALFQYFFNQFNIIPNIVSYNYLIVSHCESNEIEEALKVYHHILENPTYSPSSYTYRYLTKGLVDAGRINDAVNLLAEMLAKGHGADSLVYNNLILGFLNLGNLEKANELFDELKVRCTVYDGVVNATFMDWFFNQGKPKEAMESYRDLMERNYRMVPATRNVLLETLLKHGRKQDAWDLFHAMLDDHTPPIFQAVNSDTFNMMVNECFKEGSIAEAIDVFKRAGKAEKSRPFQMDVAGYNNMIARLCELGMMEEAEEYYQALCNKSLSPDVNTYKTLIDAYIKVDNIENMLEKYLKMVDSGLRVIPAYANKWFSFMIEKGKLFDCVTILSKMCHKEPRPDVITYDIVIRGLVESENCDAVVNLLSQMMNYSVGTTASLKEFVLDVFTNQGRRAEIENILNRSSSHFRDQRSYTGPRGPQNNGISRAPQMPQEGGHNAMPWQTAYHPQTHDTSYSSNQMTQPPQMTGQLEHVHPPQMDNTSYPTNQMTPPPQMDEQWAHVQPRSQQEMEFNHVHPRSEQEMEFNRVAGQNVA